MDEKPIKLYDEPIMIQATCPNCETVFRLTDEQLTVANGRVRCGLCLNIFTAVADTEDQAVIIPDVIHAPEPTHDESILPHINIYAGENAAPDEANNQLTNETNESGNILLSEENQHSVIPDDVRHSAEKNSTLLWGLGIFALITTLAFETIWFNRDKLALYTEAQPWVSQFCEISGCELAPIHKPELIEMVNRNIYTHPNIKKALMITATMVNHATHAQAYPDLKIGFSDVRGKMLVQRIFTPEEYMKIGVKQLQLLQPNTPISFGIEIKDPGKQALTYEFDFL